VVKDVRAVVLAVVVLAVFGGKPEYKKSHRFSGYA